MTKFCIATWNVNSIRARMENIVRWIQSVGPDIVLMQETKCVESCFPEMEVQSLGYNVVNVGQKSYNGVAILSKHPLTMEHRSLPMYDHVHTDEEARYLEGFVEFEGKIVRVASVYVPNGDSELEKGNKLEDSERFKYKLRFFDRLLKRFDELKRIDNEIVVIGGDYNVAHEAIDIHNPKSAAGKVGFHMDERNAMTRLINAGYGDVFRLFNPEVVEYSWWNYRYGGWGKNHGWRIDYMLANKNATNLVKSCRIDKETRSWEKPSDHVPVVVLLEL